MVRRLVLPRGCELARCLDGGGGSAGGGGPRFRGDRSRRGGCGGVSGLRGGGGAVRVRGCACGGRTGGFLHLGLGAEGGEEAGEEGPVRRHLEG